MASEVNSQGIPIPEVGDDVLYTPEPGKTWAAIVTGIVDVASLMVNVTAFPPGENPRGIDRAISYDQDASRQSNADTWQWKTASSPGPVQDAFAELPDMSSDPVARQARIEELGG
jgi:hypothetical protein